jgi:tetratricopeptide (TPR) repeat protein
VPLEQIGSPSLEALQACGHALEQRGDPVSITYYKRAVELDPGFYNAYAGLGAAYSNLDQVDLSIQNFKKAYGDRFAIEGWYYFFVTAEYEKAIHPSRLLCARPVQG